MSQNGVDKKDMELAEHVDLPEQKLDIQDEYVEDPRVPAIRRRVDKRL
jgi:hypothetical protein